MAGPRNWNWRLIASGLALMTLAPPALWSHPLINRVARDAGIGSSYGMLLSGVALFVLGWVLVAAGLRPQRRVWQSVASAVALYVLVGLGWEAIYVLTNPYGTPPSPVLLILALLWPLHAAFVLGLFGLGPR